jgi:hypothetical protein
VRADLARKRQADARPCAAFSAHTRVITNIAIFLVGGRANPDRRPFQKSTGCGKLHM